jgi:hypothetical protein
MLIEATYGQKQGEVAACRPNVPLTNSVIGWPKDPAWIDPAGKYRIGHAAFNRTDRMDVIAAARPR